MALINLDLGGSGTTTIDQINANDGDTIAVDALGSHTLIVDGVTVSLDSIVGVEALSTPTFQAQNGGNLTIDQGLLNIAALNSMTFNIVDDGMITLDGSALDLLSDVTNLLNSYTVDFSGADVGTFMYDPPAVSILGSISFDVTGMQAGDTLDLGGQNWDSGSYDSGTGVLTLTSAGLFEQTVVMSVEMSAADYLIYQADPSAYLSGDTFVYPGAIVCFRAGTRILTSEGYVAVEALKAGMQLRTLDGTLAPILWVGSSHLDAARLDLLPNLWPIRIKRNALGKGFPVRDMDVSPQHRIFVNGKAIAEVAECDEGLIAAKHLTSLDGVSVVRKPEDVTYFHILLPEHEVIWAENLPAESMYIGPYIAQNLAPSLRSEIALLFPDFAKRFRDGAETRFSLLSGKAARKISKSYGASRTLFFAPGKIRQTQKRSDRHAPWNPGRMAEDGLFDLDGYRQLETRNSRVTVLPVPESADLLINQQTDFIMDRIIERVSGHRQ